MRKSRFSEQQIALALQQAAVEAPIGEVCRKYGISEQTFYRWKKRFGRLTPSEIKELKGIGSSGLRKNLWVILGLGAASAPSLSTRSAGPPLRSSPSGDKLCAPARRQ